ncbi:hypothetical protein [uncultured Alteromonas sp.]|uniref:hypothetical protein n=1 Tax=uncultured Alteromonas sp. TaxID=179113 RepID=UPI0030D1477B
MKHNEILEQEQALLEEYKKVKGVGSVEPFDPNTVVLYVRREEKVTIFRFSTENKHSKANIIMLAFSSYTFDLYNKENRYHETASIMALQACRAFLPFLDIYDFDSIDLKAPTIVKAFETYKVNVFGLKPQGTGASEVLKILRRGVKTLKFKENANDYQHDQTFIHAIIDRTVLSLPVDRQQHTLTTFFSQSLWLRQYVGSSEYNKIASPKLLINSFSLSIAILLCSVQEALEAFRDFLIKHKISSRSIELNSKQNILSYKFFLRDLIHQVLSKHCLLNDLPKPVELIFRSVLSQKKLEILASGKKVDAPSIRSKSIFDLEILYKLALAATDVLNSDGKSHSHIPVSPIESRLFSWLMAWLTIQPGDIPNLTKDNFVIIQDKNEEPLYFNVKYLKGRALSRHETKTVFSSSAEGRAIINHLKKNKNEFLFGNDIGYQMNNEDCSNKSLIGLMFKTLLESRNVQERLNSAHDRRGITPFFTDCIKALVNHGVSYRAFKMQKTNAGMDYKVHCERPLAMTWFRLTHIKNSAVHASADRYKLSHLVNYNSHSSQTEASSYLTEYNQNWVNSSGRVTRTVMLDFANSVYRPGTEIEMNNSLLKLADSIDESKVELVSRTKVAECSPSKTQREIEFGFSGQGKNNTSIIVIDSAATYLQFANYLFHANASYKKLIETNPEYVEFTMLPTCEWIEFCLNEVLSPESIEEGFATHKIVKNTLPNPLESYIKI